MLCSIARHYCPAAASASAGFRDLDDEQGEVAASGRGYGDIAGALEVLAADSEEAGQAFRQEAGHRFRVEAGRDSDLMSAT